MFDWLYNSRTGAVVMMPKQIAYVQLKAGLGWHGPFDSKDAAIAYYEANKAGKSGWQKPTTNPGEAIGNIPDAIGDQVVGGMGLSNENIQSWLIRIGEILLGIVLVGVGIAKLTGTTNAVAGLVKAKI